MSIQYGKTLRFVCSIGAGVSTPATAKLSVLLGGEMMIGRAMAGVGIPLSLAAALCFALASWTPGRNPTAAPAAPL